MFDQVLELIDMLREKSYSAALQDLEDLKAFAKTQGGQSHLISLVLLHNLV